MPRRDGENKKHNLGKTNRTTTSGGTGLSVAQIVNLLYRRLPIGWALAEIRRSGHGNSTEWLAGTIWNEHVPLNDFGNWAAPLALGVLFSVLDLGRCPGVAPGWYEPGLWPASLRTTDTPG